MTLKTPTLEQLSEPLNVDRELTPDTLDELNKKIEELEEQVSDLEDEVDNERERADEAVDSEDTYKKAVDHTVDKIKAILSELQDKSKIRRTYLDEKFNEMNDLLNDL